jgi:hypothetical protein
MLKINNVVWPERKGYWQVRLNQKMYAKETVATYMDRTAESGKWVSYNNVVWC